VGHMWSDPVWYDAVWVSYNNLGGGWIKKKYMWNLTPIRRIALVTAIWLAKNNGKMSFERWRLSGGGRVSWHPLNNFPLIIKNQPSQHYNVNIFRYAQITNEKQACHVTCRTIRVWCRFSPRVYDRIYLLLYNYFYTIFYFAIIVTWF